MQSFLVFISTVLWVASSLWIGSAKGTLTYNGAEVRFPSSRFIVAILAYPMFGLVLFLIGLAGKFLILPIAALLGITLY